MTTSDVSIPTITMWCGKRLTDMTREELIEALEDAGRALNSSFETSRRLCEFNRQLLSWKRSRSA